MTGSSPTFAVTAHQLGLGDDIRQLAGKPVCSDCQIQPHVLSNGQGSARVDTVAWQPFQKEAFVRSLLDEALAGELGQRRSNRSARRSKHLLQKGFREVVAHRQSGYAR